METTADESTDRVENGTAAGAPGSFKAGMLRGLLRRCPACGGRTLFSGYLAVHQSCSACGLETGSFRADDAPPYFTIFAVGHVVIPGMLALERGVHPPYWLQLALWVPATIALTLLLLPRIKGAVIGAQWALRIRG
ncbi:MAG TPA: DUF983 domain-containing protein [Azospirillaceae bacterium]|nr:DUF983 domain-containing protein [Azospirillaceae bacterium]